MKLKFTAELKDMVIFLLFCVALLYVVAILLLNISSVANNMAFHGFNPIPAFSGEFVLQTLIFWLIALIGIMTSVSSHFFEREKGFGIATTKKDKGGYSRWAKDREMKKVLKEISPLARNVNSAGIPLMNDGKKLWVDDGEFHNLIIGSTGSGKTQITVLPLVNILAKKGESMIITDPKGEIYENTINMLKDRDYNIVLLNFRDPQRGNAWNPLNLPYTLYKNGNQDKANELLDDLAMNILYDEKAQNQDPFWEKTSADYFAGLSLALFEDASSDEINLNSINLMTTVGEEKFMGSTYIKEYFADKNQASPAYVNVASTLMAPTDTKSSILSVFKQKIKLFSSRENLSEMLGHNDFDMKDIGRKKTAVFIVIQDEKKTYHSLVTIFIKQCYETLIDVAQECGGKLPFRTNFLLDEFANMPPLKDVTTMVTAARSRNIRFNFIIQNFSQLTQVYGKENGDTIKGNCGNIIYLISSELSALEEISKMCGEVKSKEKDKTASTPLVTVSDLQRLKQWETIVLRTRMMPFKTKLTPNYKMDWGYKYEKGSYPTRDRMDIKLFDIKTFVSKKRESKFNSMLGGAPGGGNMFGGPSMPGFGGMPDYTTPMGGTPASSPNDIFKNPLPPFTPNATNNSSNMFDKAPQPNNDFNIEEIIKNIDAKIAELEAEEKAEKEAEEKKANKTGDIKDITALPELSELDINDEEPIFNPKEPFINMTVQEEKPVIEEPIKEQQPVQEIVKPNVEEKKVDDKKADITDDQFFDDFFEDE